MVKLNVGMRLIASPHFCIQQKQNLVFVSINFSIPLHRKSARPAPCELPQGGNTARAAG